MTGGGLAQVLSWGNENWSGTGIPGLVPGRYVFQYLST